MHNSEKHTHTHTHTRFTALCLLQKRTHPLRPLEAAKMDVFCFAVQGRETTKKTPPFLLFCLWVLLASFLFCRECVCVCVLPPCARCCSPDSLLNTRIGPGHERFPVIPRKPPGSLSWCPGAATGLHLPRERTLPPSLSLSLALSLYLSISFCRFLLSSCGGVMSLSSEPRVFAD